MGFGAEAGGSRSWADVAPDLSSFKLEAEICLEVWGNATDFPAESENLITFARAVTPEAYLVRFFNALSQDILHVLQNFAATFALT